MNDYVVKMQLENFEITSEYGRYDDIYFNVDFALGKKKTQTITSISLELQ